MSKYSSSPIWSSITPIPLDDGSNYISPSAAANAAASGEQQPTQITPLATIAYTPEYEEATAYLRAVMAADEMSDRALELTEDVIRLNPAHYTVWLYRAKILFSLNKDLNEELAWLNKIALKYLKNYQIWHHRQLLLSSDTYFPTLPASEPAFLKSMFDLDSKNYHVWTYRHWLVRHFKLWDSPREIQDVETLIDADVRNNSAWNHRWMLKFGPRGEDVLDGGMPVVSGSEGKVGMDVVDEDLVDAEVEYVREKILLAPQNRSPWAYVRGVLRVSGRGMAELKGFAEGFVSIGGEGGDGDVVVKSGHALEWLADVYAEEGRRDEGEGEEGEKKDSASKDWKSEALRMLTLLKEKYDPIRKNYWDYRIRALEV
ncbi:CAAX geranylgeranyltransferase alpha subunit [Arachnomyces sp. PD_36]|nr:CAAX geranylgeranyltransferase alpha subunit [Arachnomyces sp. PD_36]